MAPGEAAADALGIAATGEIFALWFAAGLPWSITTATPEPTTTTAAIVTAATTQNFALNGNLFAPNDQRPG